MAVTGAPMLVKKSAMASAFLKYSRELPLRWAAYIGVVLVLLVFGAYGDNYDPAAFIYAQF